MLSFELHVCLKMDTLIGFLTMKTAGTYLFRIEASWILSQSGGGLHPGLITRWVVPMNSHNFWQMLRYTVGDCMMPSHFRMLINWKVWNLWPFWRQDFLRLSWKCDGHHIWSPLSALEEQTLENKHIVDVQYLYRCFVWFSWKNSQLVWSHARTRAQELKHLSI